MGGRGRARNSGHLARAGSAPASTALGMLWLRCLLPIAGGLTCAEGGAVGGTHGHTADEALLDADLQGPRLIW